MREICDETGVALIFDEIQTGMGRTGTMWRCLKAEGVTPDIMTYGKAFGGGILPITGIICKPKMWVQELIDNPWLLGSPTFGGNPVCCSAALATIQYMLETTSPASLRDKGAVLKVGLEQLAAKVPQHHPGRPGCGADAGGWSSTPATWAMPAPGASSPGRSSLPAPWSTPRPSASSRRR